MRKRNKIYSVLTLLLATTLCFSTTACSQAQQPAEPAPAQEEATVPEPSVPEQETETAKESVPETETEPSTAALSVKALQPKQVDENPYMAKSEVNIHHDGYNTDSTDEILPLGIYPEINV